MKCLLVLCIEPICTVFLYNKECLLFLRNYEVRAKPSSGKSVMDDMHKWIVDNYAHKSGIVYCFSKKESEEVAKELSSRGGK